MLFNDYLQNLRRCLIREMTDPLYMHTSLLYKIPYKSLLRKKSLMLPKTSFIWSKIQLNE